MVFHTKDGFGGCLGLTSHVRLGLNGADLGELFDLWSQGPCLMVVPVKLWDKRKKRLFFISVRIITRG